MLIYRYYCLYGNKDEIGIFMSGIDYNRIERIFNRPYYPFIHEYSEKIMDWLKDPEISGEYWFTEKGNKMFKEKVFSYLVDRLPRNNSKAIYRKTIDLNELQNWQNLVLYQDEHQIVF